jgi:ABC-type polysaccharide/polyol phosphate export permease
LKIYYKELGTFILILQTVAMFFSNVYFDISVLPSFLRPVAYIFPTYYSITSLKIALLSGGNLPSFVTSYLFILLAVCAGSLILGKFIFRRSFNKARKDGALAYY